MTTPGNNHNDPADSLPEGEGVSLAEMAELRQSFSEALDDYMEEWESSLRERVNSSAFGERVGDPTDNEWDPSLHPRDEHGRFGETGHGGHIDIPHDIHIPKLKDRARVGVPGNEVPPPPQSGIPRLPNLSESQRAVESRYVDAYLKDPDGEANKYLRALRDGKVGVATNVFATDDAKMLNRDFNPSLLHPGEKITPENLEAMASNNTALHGTANAIAKRAFVKALDDLAELPEGHQLRSVLVTNGGCAAGKGSTLSHAAEPDSPYNKLVSPASQVGAVWDAAGEQNATENKWVYDECRKRGLSATFAYVWAEPKDTWQAKDRGVIRRAEKKGRMVDARLFADSYAEGAKNMAAFVHSHGDAEGAKFVFIDNRIKGSPKLLDSFPKETLRWNGGKIYKDAVASLKSLKSKLPRSLYKAGLAGGKIWGPPAVNEQLGATGA